MKKNKSTTGVLASFEEVDNTLCLIAVLQLEAEKKENAMNQKILGIKKEYELEVKELKDKIASFEEKLETFCRANKKEFSAIRSKELTYGRIGFRFGKYALKFISKKYNLEYAKQKLMDLFGTRYVDTEIKLNKNKILDALEKQNLTEEKLALAGLKRVKSENSFYEINWDEIKLIDAKR